MIVTLERSLCTHQAEIGWCRVTYACGWMCMCMEFRDKILLRGGECESSENPDFLMKDKMVISIKIRNFSRSRMTKRTSPLESSREISLPRRISSNSGIVRISRFLRHREGCRTLSTFWVAQEAPRVKLWDSQTLSSSGNTWDTWHHAIRGKSHSGWIRG